MDVELLQGSPGPAGSNLRRRSGFLRRLIDRRPGAGGTAFGSTRLDETSPERILGALVALLRAEGKIEVGLRKLLAARRQLLEGHRETEIEAHLDELQAGFETVARVTADELSEPAASDPPGDFVRAVAARGSAAGAGAAGL